MVQTQQPDKLKTFTKEPKKKKKDKKEGDDDDEETDEEIDGEEYERRVMEGEEVIQPLSGATANEVQNNGFQPPLGPADVKVDLSASADAAAQPYTQARPSDNVEPTAPPEEPVKVDGSSGQQAVESQSFGHKSSSRGSDGNPAASQEPPSVDTNYPTVAPPSYDAVVTSQPGTTGSTGSTEDGV